MRIFSTFFLFFICCASNSLFSQDTLNTKEDIDTIIVNKDPLIIKKTVYVAEPIKKRKIKESWIELVFSPFSTFNYYSVCPCNKDYFDKYKATTSSLSLGYFVRSNFSYFINNFSLSTGIGYVAIREKFKFTSETQGYNMTRKTNYISFPISVGYRVINETFFQLIPSAGISLEKLISTNGLTISKEDFTKVENISSVIKYYPYQYQGFIKCKFVFSSLGKTYYAIEPNFYADLGSITQSSAPFVQQRYNVGVSGNVIIKLN